MTLIGMAMARLAARPRWKPPTAAHGRDPLPLMGEGRREIDGGSADPGLQSAIVIGGLKAWAVLLRPVGAQSPRQIFDPRAAELVPILSGCRHRPNRVNRSVAG